VSLGAVRPSLVTLLPSIVDPPFCHSQGIVDKFPHRNTTVHDILTIVHRCVDLLINSRFVLSESLLGGITATSNSGSNSSSHSITPSRLAAISVLFLIDAKACCSTLS